ncbi:uncharacterized protein LOC132286995 [Cornus florida]|uniref:uncharacterized protein LOC132286995 n=1 Tax=Cornus florida TaxID=4283 RepID=UPI00289FCE53|nr:uncharacterized protein LOC132286995 [Cornus florida]
MEIPSEQQIASICSHCNKAIPAQNFDLHIVHCSRNLERCKICGDMIPRKHAEEHYIKTHAPVTCTLCSETVERETLALHKGEFCPQRIVTCEYCEFPLPAVDLFKHQEVCGNRTEYCHLCHKYIRLRERTGHENRCHGSFNGTTVGTSRDFIAPGREEVGGRRQVPHYFSRKNLLLTIAVAGFAVLLGSLFFQREADKQLHH